MKNRDFLFVFAFMCLWVIVTVVAVTWGTHYDWADNVHTDYGLPFVWSTNTVSTIVGAVNLWEVDMSALMMNLSLWLGIMVLVTVVMLYFFNKKSN
jgi:hypothetical protein